MKRSALGGVWGPNCLKQTNHYCLCGEVRRSALILCKMLVLKKDQGHHTQKSINGVYSDAYIYIIEIIGAL